jgi:hypothetical protein
VLLTAVLMKHPDPVLLKSNYGVRILLYEAQDVLLTVVLHAPRSRADTEYSPYPSRTLDSSQTGASPTRTLRKESDERKWYSSQFMIS